MTKSPISKGHKKRIAAAIRNGHLSFLAELLGPNAISPIDYRRLKRSGKIHHDKQLRESIPEAAHAIGIIVGGNPDAQQSKEALRSIRARLAAHVKDLGSSLDTHVDRIITDIEVAARHRSDKGRDKRQSKVLADAVARIKAAVKRMRWRWTLIARTEVHNAVEETKAITMSQKVRDPVVFKLPRPDACEHCKRLFLKPDGKTPRLFKLSALAGMGSNVGRSVGEWKAVMGSVHPCCACELHLVPEGMTVGPGGILTHLNKSETLEIEALDLTQLHR